MVVVVVVIVVINAIADVVVAPIVNAIKIDRIEHETKNTKDK